VSRRCSGEGRGEAQAKVTAISGGDGRSLPAGRGRCIDSRTIPRRNGARQPTPCIPCPSSCHPPTHPRSGCRLPTPQSTNEHQSLREICGKTKPWGQSGGVSRQRHGTAHGRPSAHPLRDASASTFFLGRVSVIRPLTHVFTQYPFLTWALVLPFAPPAVAGPGAAAMAEYSASSVAAAGWLAVVGPFSTKSFSQRREAPSLQRGQTVFTFYTKGDFHRTRRISAFNRLLTCSFLLFLSLVHATMPGKEPARCGIPLVCHYLSIFLAIFPLRPHMHLDE
jgi:hypothetical protein